MRMFAGRAVAALLTVVAGGFAAVAGAAEARVQLDAGVSALAAAPAVILAVSALSWTLVGAILTWHRPRSGLGWLILVTGTATQVSVAAETSGRAGWTVPGTEAAVTWSFAAGLLLYLTIGLLPLLYPSRVRGRGALIAATLVVVGALVQQVQWWLAQHDPAMTWAFGPPSDGVPTWALWAPVLAYAAGVVLGWALCVARLLRAAYPERQQLAWLLCATVFFLLVMALGDSVLALWLQAVAVPLVAVAIGVGVLQYRLLGIETALPRTVTYVVLVVLASGVYLGVAAWAGVQLAGAVLPAAVGAAVLTVVMLPLRSRVESLVERLLYGRRADAVASVVDVARVAESSPRLLEIALERVAAAFRARGAVLLGADGVERARHGVQEDAAVTADLVVGGELLGQVGLVARRPGEPFHRRDTETLATVAAQVALLWRAVQAADQLQEQRDAVMAATRAERDRLRRDLHDGLGPSLTGVGLGLQALDDALATVDVVRAQELTGVLAAEMERAVAEVRRVLDDLRPLDLTSGDLGEALRRRADTIASPVTVRLEVDRLPALEPGIEDAVYRVVSEAMTNALRHADPGGIAVEVAMQDGELVARVVDDGAGLPSLAPDGIGITSMRERARAVGGRVEIVSGHEGTTVTMRVPMGGAA